MRTKHLALVVFLLSVACSYEASARPAYYSAWLSYYPDSTLPARMEALTGSDCNVCHHPPNRPTTGNCYRADLIGLLEEGLSITEAIEQLDTEDSDGDGVPNGEEATTPRADQPGEVGYNMGLIGDTGTDPCADDPNEVVTNQSETPPPPIPTVSEWGMIAMTLLILAIGTVIIRKPRDAVG